MKKIEVYEKTYIMGGIYDDTNYQNTFVYADGEELVEYDPKIYPPFCYGGHIVIDNSKSFEEVTFKVEDKGEEGVEITIYPPHGCELVRNYEKDETFYDD